jgi:hypothetical protein
LIIVKTMTMDSTKPYFLLPVFALPVAALEP